MFIEMDANVNGVVTKEDFINYVRSRPQLQNAMYEGLTQSALNEHDEVACGKVTPRPSQPVRMIGNRRIINIYKDIDVNKNGVFNWEEFLDFFGRTGILLKYATSDNPRARMADVLAKEYQRRQVVAKWQRGGAALEVGRQAELNHETEELHSQFLIDQKEAQLNTQWAAEKLANLKEQHARGRDACTIAIDSVEAFREARRALGVFDRSKPFVPSKKVVPLLEPLNPEQRKPELPAFEIAQQSLSDTEVAKDENNANHALLSPWRRPALHVVTEVAADPDDAKPVLLSPWRRPSNLLPSERKASEALEADMEVAENPSDKKPVLLSPWRRPSNVSPLDEQKTLEHPALEVDTQATEDQNDARHALLSPWRRSLQDLQTSTGDLHRLLVSSDKTISEVTPPKCLPPQSVPTTTPLKGLLEVPATCNWTSPRRSPSKRRQNVMKAGIYLMGSPVKHGQGCSGSPVKRGQSCSGSPVKKRGQGSPIKQRGSPIKRRESSGSPTKGSPRKPRRQVEMSALHPVAPRWACP